METVIFQALGGLGMFLFGMKVMSEGLQKVAGKKLRQILNMVSNNRFVGCGVGAAITSIVQSSSATTVMLVSFVDTGLMSLTQAVGVILGANIGTTITAQLIAFKITAYALPAIAAGTFFDVLSSCCICIIISLRDLPPNKVSSVLKCPLISETEVCSIFAKNVACRIRPLKHISLQ